MLLGRAQWSKSSGKPCTEDSGRLTCSETVYAAYEPVIPGQKHALYQWSLPDGVARHVAEAIAHTCMAPGCGRQFGLLGESSDLHGMCILSIRAEETLWRVWRRVLRDARSPRRDLQSAVLRAVSRRLVPRRCVGALWEGKLGCVSLRIRGTQIKKRLDSRAIASSERLSITKRDPIEKWHARGSSVITSWGGWALELYVVDLFALCMHHPERV